MAIVAGVGLLGGTAYLLHRKSTERQSTAWASRIEAERATGRDAELTR